MVITKMHLSRRTVLRGLGATIALPFLDSMVPALTALAKTAAAPVRRFGVFYVPNGMSMPYWFPKAEGAMAALPPDPPVARRAQGSRAADGRSCRRSPPTSSRAAAITRDRRARS